MMHLDSPRVLPARRAPRFSRELLERSCAPMGAGLAFFRPPKFAGPVPVPTSISAMNHYVIDTAGGGQRLVFTVADSTGCTSLQLTSGPAGTSFAIDDATHVSCLAPAHAAGAVSWTVTNAGGTSAPFAGAQYWSPSDATSAAPSHRFRADQGITLAGANVSQWNDMIGTMHQSSAASVNKPTLATPAGYGGMPTVHCTTAYFDHMNPATLATGISVFLIGNGVSGSQCSYVSCSSASPYDLLWRQASDTVQFFAAASALGSSPVTETGPSSILFEDDGGAGAAAARLSLGKLSTYDATGTTAWGSVTGLDIGKTSAGVSSFQGDLAEVVIFSGSLSGGEKALLSGYCAQRYGLTIAP